MLKAIAKIATLAFHQEQDDIPAMNRTMNCNGINADALVALLLLICLQMISNIIFLRLVF
jgi:hypothetical protein